MDSNLDINSGLPIFLLTNNHPEKFFEKSTYQFEPQAVSNVNKLKQIFLFGKTASLKIWIRHSYSHRRTKKW